MEMNQFGFRVVEGVFICWAGENSCFWKGKDLDCSWQEVREEY